MKIGGINKTYTQNGISKTKNTKTTGISETKSDSADLSNKNKKKKIGIAFLAAGTVIAVAAAAIYKHKKLSALKNIPEDLKPLFEELKGKNGKEFIDDAYSGLKKHMKLEGIAPEKVILGNKGDPLGNKIIGGFSPLDNTIEYSNGFLTRLKKDQQFNLLSHELKHCKQYSTILRTEGLGAEALASASAENAIYHGENLFGTVAEQVQKLPKEEAERIIAEQKEKFTKQSIDKINSVYEKVLKMPKFTAGSEEGIKAKEYLQAIRDYEGLSFLGTEKANYRNNLLEKEAYAYGEKMENYFKNLSSPFDKLKDYIRIIKNSKSGTV